MKANKEWFDNVEKSLEKNALWAPLTLGDQLKLWAAKYNDRAALIEDDIRLSYSELDRKADELASGLLKLGIRKGKNVVVQLPNRISFIITCFALFRIGAQPVLALPAQRETELDGIFSLAKPVAYIVPDTFLGFDYKEMAERLLEKHPCVKFIITDGTSENGRRLADIAMPPVTMASPSPTDTALLLLSGGTTGTPKLIPRTHMDYAYNAKACAMRCRLTPESVYLAVLPVSHNFPLCCPGILGTLSAGGKVVLCRTTSCDEAFPLIEKERVTITALVPALVKLWLEELEWNTGIDISSLEVLQVGGSMLDENLAKRIMPAMQCKLQQIYGMAEGLICCTSLHDPEHIILTCQGRPISPEDEIRIVDEKGNEVPTGEFGELLVRGPYTIRGYYRMPDRGFRDFTPDGFFRSGDRARITPEGNIHIGGRVKEQINRAGEKITPAEIESYLCSHPEIDDAILIGIPDENLGERSCACLITDNRGITLTDIHRFLTDRGVARYKLPDQIEHVDFWPLTNIGKVDKSKLKEQVMQQENRKESVTHYHEGTFDFNGDPFPVATHIAQTGFFNEYMLYENKGELSLGMGMYALVSVDAEHTTLTINGKTMQLDNRTLSETINEVFSQVNLENWRAYGIANYELARHNNGLPLPDEKECLLKLFIPEVEIRFEKDVVFIRAIEEQKLNDMREMLQSMAEGARDKNGKNFPAPKSNGEKLQVPGIDDYDSEHYMKIVEESVGEIRARKYQKVILSRKIPLDRELDMVASYLTGRQVNSPARSFLFNFDGLTAAGFSPETVVEVDDQGRVYTQPLAGTRALGSCETETDRLREELLNDSKEIAEHAVSVKLAFEELSDVCDAESVAVSDFMSIAHRGTVQHIASRLRGDLKPGYNPWHAFNALFPAVTASGIPKKESVDAIGRFERHPRNLYSGCVLTYDSNGAMDAALVLRTIFQKDRKAWLHVGAGIVEMSVPSRELTETCEKLESFSRQLIFRKRQDDFCAA
jgi:yersiniabactin salicyl-AMP ligase